MNNVKNCHRCGSPEGELYLWMGKVWCDRCFEKQTGHSHELDSSPKCELCGDELLMMKSLSMHSDSLCLHCLLQLGPDRARILLKVKKLDSLEVATAVRLLRELLTQNQTLRLREAIQQGGQNWWVKLPEFGEYVCRFLAENGISWDGEVLDEVWDRLVQEAVEE